MFTLVTDFQGGSESLSSKLPYGFDPTQLQLYSISLHILVFSSSQQNVCLLTLFLPKAYEYSAKKRGAHPSGFHAPLTFKCPKRASANAYQKSERKAHKVCGGLVVH